MSSRTIALLTLVLASFLWSSAGVVAKILLPLYTPFPLAAARYVLATLFILPFFWKGHSKQWQKLLSQGFWVGLLSAGNIAFYYLGLTKTTVNASVIIYTATPLVVAAISYFLLSERLSKQKTVAILIGFLGVLITLILPILQKGQSISGDFLGNIYIVFALVCFALYTIYSRYLITKKQYSPIAVTTMTLFITAVIFVLLTMFITPFRFTPTIAKPTNLLLLLHLALFVTVATYLLYQWAIKHSSSTTASFTVYLQPVFSFALAIIFLREPFTVGYTVGSALVFIGVALFTGTKAFASLKELLKLKA